MKAMLFLLASVASAQTVGTPSVFGWNGKAYAFIKLGPTLKLANGQLDAGGDYLTVKGLCKPDASVAAPVVNELVCWNSCEAKALRCKNDNGMVTTMGAATAGPRRKWDVLVSYDTARLGWVMPSEAIAGSIVLRVNGITYHRGLDWDLVVPVSGPIVAVPKADNMLPEHLVTVDYDY